MALITFTDIVADCYIDNIKILTDNIERMRAYRIPKFDSPGAPGERTQHLGRKSLVDTVQALITLDDLKKLEALADKPTTVTWTHPLKAGFQARIESISEPLSSDLDGYLRATIVLVEDYNPDLLTLPQTVLTLTGAKNKSKAKKDDLTNNVNSIPDWDADSGSASWDTTGDFASSYADLNSGYDSLETVYEEVEAGDSNWRDLNRQLGIFSDLADTFVDAARVVEDSLEDLAEPIIRAPAEIIDIGHDAIETLTDDVSRVVSFAVTDATDLPTILQDAFGSQDLLESVVEQNNIEDIYNIPPGAVLTIQRENA